MPIYEYRCSRCGLKNTLFSPSMAAASAAEERLVCERCGSPALKRLLSSFSLGRPAETAGEELYKFDQMTAGLDENEPRQLARWAASQGADPDSFDENPYQNVEPDLDPDPDLDPNAPEEASDLPA